MLSSFIIFSLNYYIYYCFSTFSSLFFSYFLLFYTFFLSFFFQLPLRSFPIFHFFSTFSRLVFFTEKYAPLKISGGATEDSPCHNKDHFHFNKDHFTLSCVATSENVPYWSSIRTIFNCPVSRRTIFSCRVFTSDECLIIQYKYSYYV